MKFPNLYDLVKFGQAGLRIVKISKLLRAFDTQCSVDAVKCCQNFWELAENDHFSKYDSCVKSDSLV